MRVHHKQPSLVSMWMLDVFCCALGCVTLLFLVNSRMASDDSQANRTALLNLQTTERKLAAALSELKKTSEEREKLAADFTRAEGLRINLDAEVAKLTTRLATTDAQNTDLAKKLALATKEAKDAKALADATQTALNAAEAKRTADAKELASADDILRKRQKEVDALTKKLTDSTAAADELARLLRKRDDEKVALSKQVTDLKKELDDLDAKVLAARKELDNATAAAKAAATKGGEELATAKGQIKDLLKKVDDANATIIDLQGDKAKLADKYDKLQKDTDARFAGIVTSGKRVVFVVDISGSMSKKDTDTADPTKWPTVVETVGKVMRSVAGMEKYQVVVFSSSAKWLFGTAEWQDYLGERSVDTVKAALLKEKPYDDTNLYAGLEKAFSLRDPGGLDTVYLFSDGLPTSGPGLTLAQQTANPPLKEIERSEILGKHIRRTLDTAWNRPLVGRPKVKIHAVGFYFESPEVGAFLWGLARENDGSFVGMSKP